MSVAALSILLVAGVGFIAHRASVCMVRGVAEVFSTGRAYMLLSFLKAVVWVTALGIPLAWLAGPAASGVPSFPIHAGAVIGGFVFGIGAAINGGCSISTVTRLGGGDLGMLVALLAIALGAFGVIAAATVLNWPLVMPVAVDAAAVGPTPFVLALLAPLWLWLGIEVVRLWHRRPVKLTWRDVLLNDRGSLSVAAATMGAAAAVLCVLEGAWMYAGALRDLGDALFGHQQMPRAALALFLAALIGGAILSALLRGTCRPRWPGRAALARHVLGGVLMGAGAAMVPGGNAALMLHGLPALSLHAAPGLAAMTLGIAAAFLVTQMRNGVVPLVDCTGDVCRST